MSSEANVQRAVWLGLGSTGTTVLFRLNTGKGWISSIGPRGVHQLKDGSIHIEAPRPIALGFGMVNGDPVVGAPDLVGYTMVKVTQEMVGQTIAVLTSIETKRTKGGRASPEQVNWLKRIQTAGGIAGIANSVESARDTIDTWFEKFV